MRENYTGYLKIIFLVSSLKNYLQISVPKLRVRTKRKSKKKFLGYLFAPQMDQYLRGRSKDRWCRLGGRGGTDLRDATPILIYIEVFLR